jgi:ABC-type Fe3+ transport system permease subunit
MWMKMFRWLRRLGVAVLWAAALAPALALLPAAVLDRGPDGSIRPSLFPIAMSLLDPLVGDCTRNSLTMAALVTFAARVVGVGLARVATRWRFWGRGPLAALACAGLVVPPALGAIGLRCLFGSDWGAAVPEAWGWVLPWAGWFVVGLSCGAPLVALASASALGRVDPAWEEAARLEGAGRARVWRQLVWPVIRPEVAPALGLVFTLTLLEPGAPLVLGLRRTLGFQIVESATDGGVGQLTRAVVLALGGTLLAGLGRLLIGWWGGRQTPGFAERVDDLEPRAEPALLGRALVFGLLLSTAVCVVWLPVFGAFSTALTATNAPHATRLGTALAGFAMVVGNPLTRGYLIHSALLGLAVVAVDVLLARSLAAWPAARRGRTGAIVAWLASWTERVPALAIGVGVLALPRVVEMAADAWDASGSGVSVAPALHALIDLVDVDRAPGVALVLGVALAQLPLLARSALAHRRQIRPVLLEAAVSLGATPRASRRTLSGRWLGAAPAAAILTFALAATNAVPALLLAPTALSRPLGPAALILIDEPGGGRARAATLVSMAMAVNLVALAVAARRRSGVPREWLRG